MAEGGDERVDSADSDGSRDDTAEDVTAEEILDEAFPDEEIDDPELKEELSAALAADSTDEGNGDESDGCDESEDGETDVSEDGEGGGSTEDEDEDEDEETSDEDEETSDEDEDEDEETSDEDEDEDRGQTEDSTSIPDSELGTGTSADGGFEGAPDDQEMPLTEHIEEMLKRLAAVVVVMGGVSLLIFPVAPDLINWLWYSFLPGSPDGCVDGVSDTTACPRVYHPLGLLFARIKVASLVGFVLALPVFVYQTYLFMRPGLYPHERRYYLAAVPTSLLLAFVGLAFSYFLILPVIFTYFLYYSQDVAEIAFGLTETFDLILLMMGLFAAIFQIPLFIMLAIMMGVTTRDWLEDKRYYFWLGFAGFAFIFSPDPTGMAPFMVGITMVALYELTLLLLRWTGR